jgi:hypothetical protein
MRCRSKKRSKKPAGPLSAEQGEQGEQVVVAGQLDTVGSLTPAEPAAVEPAASASANSSAASSEPEMKAGVCHGSMGVFARGLSLRRRVHLSGQVWCMSTV